MMGPNSVRHLLYGVSFIFVLMGIVILSHAMENVFFFRKYGELIPNQYHYMSLFQISVAVAIFCISVLGWYGALSENSFFSLIFTSSLLLIFFLLMAVGIGGLLLKLTTHNSLTVSLQLPNNSTDFEMIYKWDRLQSDYSCCGIETAFDWLNQPNGTIPASCCYNLVYWKDNKCNHVVAHKMGCFLPLHIDLLDNCSCVMILGFTTAIMQLLGIVVCCYLTGEFRKDYLTVN